MTSKARRHVDDLRGASRLVIDAARGITSLVEAMHVAIASGPAVLGRPLQGAARLTTAPVYGIVRGVMQLVGSGIELALAPWTRLLGSSAPSFEREAAQSALNAVVGDYLHDTGNPLAITMQLRHEGAPIEIAPEPLHRALPHATAKLAVLIHGLGGTDLQWARSGHDHGAALARDLGYTPVYAHYNTGRHVSSNGRELAVLLEALTRAWPVALDEIVLVGHSMGGLVARSACHAAEAAGHTWRSARRARIRLGTPHPGAPLERHGNLLEQLLGSIPYVAPFGRLSKIRSAGITDLRYGNVIDAHWHGVDRFAHGADSRAPVALPAGVACYAIAGELATAAGRALLGDGLVPVASALGDHARPELALAFPDAQRWIAAATDHMALLDSPAVYRKIAAWLAARPAELPSAAAATTE